MLGWLRKRPGKRSAFALDTPLLRLGRHDPFTIGDSFQTTLVMGGTGSGKTSGPGYQLTLAMMTAGFGGLCMTVKVDEADRIRRLAARAGRTDDLIVFDEASGYGLSFMNYLLHQQGAESGKTENLLFLIESMAEIAERANGSGASRQDETFWKNGRRELGRNAIDLLSIVMKQLAPHLIVEVIRDAPQSEAEVANPDWWKQSTVGQLLLRGEQMGLTPHVRHDFEQVKLYFTRTFPRLAEKTRSIIEASLMGVLDPFCRGLLYRLFCNQTTVVPEDTLDGKIIVVNQPLKRDLTIGLLAQTIWKVLFQGRMEQRQEGETRPTFLIMDEAHMLLSLKDLQFFSTARASRVATLWMTQNLPNVLVALGENEGSNAKAESILSLAQTKIFCQNSCPVTNQWASDLIGRKRIWLSSSNVSSPRQNFLEIFPMDEEQISIGSSETFEYTLQPNEFTRLTKGGKHGYCDAIVFQGGRNWRGSKENFARVTFKQGF